MLPGRTAPQSGWESSRYFIKESWNQTESSHYFLFVRRNIIVSLVDLTMNVPTSVRQLLRAHSDQSSVFRRIGAHRYSTVVSENVTASFQYLL